MLGVCIYQSVNRREKARFHPIISPCRLLSVQHTMELLRVRCRERSMNLSTVKLYRWPRALCLSGMKSFDPLFTHYGIWVAPLFPKTLHCPSFVLKPFTSDGIRSSFLASNSFRVENGRLKPSHVFRSWSLLNRPLVLLVSSRFSALFHTNLSTNSSR